MILLFVLMGCTPSFTSPSFESTMVFFAASTFDMGFPDVEVGPYGNHWKETAQPQHEVSLPDFWIDINEVTVQQYAEFLTAIESDMSGAAFSHHHPLQPIIWENGAFVPSTNVLDQAMHYVSFYDALAYCGWRGSSLPP